MIIDTAPAFKGGNQGMTLYLHADGFMASVKSAQGGFLIGYGATPALALSAALRLPPDDDILGDLL